MDVLLSALQHFVFCPRQCALIHLEHVWQDNSHTVQGMQMHEAAHSGDSRTRNGIKVVTDLELSSARLGVYGRADVVEFRREGNLWRPYPIEYKKGRPSKGSDANEVQLCAQALCLEEMLDIDISEGSLFYGEVRRRKIVLFGADLRRRTEQVIKAVRELMISGASPLPVRCSSCDSCSLNEYCLPKIREEKASSYIKKLCEGTL